MPNFNKVILLGSLVEKPELRRSPGGNAHCTFTLLVKDTHKTAQGEIRERTDEFDVVCHGKQAETIARYLDKGSPIFVEGRLVRKDPDGAACPESWVVVQRFQFVGGRGEVDR